MVAPSYTLAYTVPPQMDRDHWDWLQTDFCPVCRTSCCSVYLTLSKNFDMSGETRGNICHVTVAQYSSKSLCLSVSSTLSHICVLLPAISSVCVLTALQPSGASMSFCLSQKPNCGWSISSGCAIQVHMKLGFLQRDAPVSYQVCYFVLNVTFHAFLLHL